MPSLILPGRFTSQPQYPAAIDRSNPLTNGLVFVSGSLPVDSYGFDVAKHAAWTATAAPTRVPTSQGQAYKFVAASTQYLSVAQSVLGNLTGGGGGFTVASVATPLDTTTAGTLIALGRSSSATPYIWLEVNATAAKATFNTRDDGGTNATAVTTATFVANQPIVAIGVQYSFLSRAVYLNGLSGAGTNATTQGGTAAWTLDRTAIGALVRNTVATPYSGSIALSAIWNRALTDTEIQAFSANPWQLFLYPSRRLWVPSAGVAGGFFARYYYDMIGQSRIGS